MERGCHSQECRPPCGKLGQGEGRAWSHFPLRTSGAGLRPTGHRTPRTARRFVRIVAVTSYNTIHTTSRFVRIVAVTSYNTIHTTSRFVCIVAVTSYNTIHTTSRFVRIVAVTSYNTIHTTSRFVRIVAVTSYCNSVHTPPFCPYCRCNSVTRKAVAEVRTAGHQHAVRAVNRSGLQVINTLSVPLTGQDCRSSTCCPCR